MHLSHWAIAALLALSACTPLPVVEEPPPEVAPPDRGTPVTFTKATYGGYADNALEDVLSFAAQGDQAAVDEMITRPNPWAIAVAEGEEWIFEGCYYGKYRRDLAWLRQQGSTDKWVFMVEDLAVDR